MSLAAAYLGIIVIWSTTPLAIQWGTLGLGFQTAVTLRMLIGLAVALAVLRLFGRRLPWGAAAQRRYAVGTLGIWGAMSCVYYGAQFIPSGLISVVYGLSPLTVSLLAGVWLGERCLDPTRVAGLLLGLGGLGLIFLDQLALGDGAMRGVLAVLASMFLHALSAVWLKRLDQLEARPAGFGPLAQTAGGLLWSVPLFLLAGWLQGSPLPADWTPRALAATAYLAIFGSVLGFALYYYALQHLRASTMALITLITPVTALWLGVSLNSEVLQPGVVTGTALILAGLGLHQLGERRARRRLAAAAPEPG